MHFGMKSRSCFKEKSLLTGNIIYNFKQELSLIEHQIINATA